MFANRLFFSSVWTDSFRANQNLDRMFSKTTKQKVDIYFGFYLISFKSLKLEFLSIFYQNTKEKSQYEFQKALLEIRKKTKLKSDKNFLAQIDFQEDNSNNF